MNYYERVKLFRDNQQILLDEFLAEVVSTGLITKTTENTKQNRDKVYERFIWNKASLFREDLLSRFVRLEKRPDSMQPRNKIILQEIILELQYNLRFWDIVIPILRANRKLEQVKYFAQR